MMDERLIKIVKPVAIGVQDDMDGMHVACAFCGGEKVWERVPEDIEIIQHHALCPTLFARELLREWGTPLQVYRVDYEDRRTVRKTHTWIPIHQYRLSTSAEEAMQDFTWEGIRNVQASVIREYPEGT